MTTPTNGSGKASIPNVTTGTPSGKSTVPTTNGKPLAPTGLNFNKGQDFLNRGFPHQGGRGRGSTNAGNSNGSGSFPYNSRNGTPPWLAGRGSGGRNANNGGRGNSGGRGTPPWLAGRGSGGRNRNNGGRGSSGGRSGGRSGCSGGGNGNGGSPTWFGAHDTRPASARQGRGGPSRGNGGGKNLGGSGKKGNNGGSAGRGKFGDCRAVNAATNSIQAMTNILANNFDAIVQDGARDGDQSTRSVVSINIGRYPQRGNEGASRACLGGAPKSWSHDDCFRAHRCIWLFLLWCATGQEPQFVMIMYPYNRAMQSDTFLSRTQFILAALAYVFACGMNALPSKNYDSVTRMMRHDRLRPMAQLMTKFIDLVIERHLPRKFWRGITKKNMKPVRIRIVFDGMKKKLKDYGTWGEDGFLEYHPCIN